MPELRPTAWLLLAPRTSLTKSRTNASTADQFVYSWSCVLADDALHHEPHDKAVLRAGDRSAEVRAPIGNPSGEPDELLHARLSLGEPLLRDGRSAKGALKLRNGQHVITAAAPIGISVYGYGQYTSRNSVMYAALTRVDPTASVGSVNENADRPRAMRMELMRARNSMM